MRLERVVFGRKIRTEVSNRETQSSKFLELA